MPGLHVSAAYQPTGDQPRAIGELAEAISRGDQYQTLLGATATGKTHTMARVIEKVQKPTLVIAHNKTLAAQLCNEFREYFPTNAVEYFVSYYDYYQPEAYLPSSDTYIEKDSSINDDIDRLRHAATAALFARRDVVIVASVSCIYGIGSPESYSEMVLLRVGRRRALARVDPDQAGRHPLPAKRRGHGPRPVPRPRRRDRGAAGRHRVRLPDQPLRRRGRVDHALRPDDGGGLRSARPPRRLSRDALRDGAKRARGGGQVDRRGAARAPARARGRGQDARGAPAPLAHGVRHGDAARDGLLQRHRELLAPPRRARAGDAAAHAARLLPRRLS